ncbi:hypothetical protein Mapa_012523 [Marchantia paleacea]|nr:hypothetical protein Mapa_012523 [Marchantia paleacea]
MDQAPGEDECFAFLHNLGKQLVRVFWVVAVRHETSVNLSLQNEQNFGGQTVSMGHYHTPRVQVQTNQSQTQGIESRPVPHESERGGCVHWIACEVCCFC